MNNNLEDVLTDQMILSIKNNYFIRNQLVKTINAHISQNAKYHLLWLFLHSFSFEYPINPSDEFKLETVNFIANVIPENISNCSSCQNHYKKYIRQFNIYRVVSSRDELSHFFFDMHNNISNEKSKLYEIKNDNKFLLTDFEYNNYTYEQIQQYYKDNNFIYQLENKYNINIFKLIEMKKLHTFFDLFNSIKFNVEDYKFSIKFDIE